MIAMEQINEFEWSGILLKFSIRISSIKLKAKNWLEHQMAVTFYLELFSSGHQRSLVGIEPVTSQLLPYSGYDWPKS